MRITFASDGAQLIGANISERFYFGDHVLPCFEIGIPLLKQRLHQLPDAENINIAFPDDGAWKRFYKQLQHFPMLEKRDGTPKDQLSSIKQILKELQRKREERMKEFCDIQSQIIQVHEALRGSVVDEQIVDDKDSTTKRLRELKLVLQGLQSEKKISDNIKSIHELSDVLSVDLSMTVGEVLIHPCLCSYFANSQLNNISDVSCSRLGESVDSLKQEKDQRLRKLQDLRSTLIELWNTLDTRADQRERFDPITTLISVTVDEVTARGSLALDIIKQAKVEIEKLKASKMEKLVLEKQKGDQNRYCARRDARKNLKRAKRISQLDSLQQDTFIWLEREEENKRPRAVEKHGKRVKVSE
ncbi:hypothetical protein Sjap_004958 [Stephania japonica]|uniref:65-kDa microtubule-associated protein 5 n=1 Tax=Stephania japonica TaxID=461633 RepID=A0AAP0K467_9MAGN